MGAHQPLELLAQGADLHRGAGVRKQLGLGRGDERRGDEQQGGGDRQADAQPPGALIRGVRTGLGVCRGLAPDQDLEP